MSALTNIASTSLLAIDLVCPNGNTPALAKTTMVIDASAEKMGWYGFVFHPSRPTGTFNIRKIGFVTGTVAVNSASTLTIGFQGLGTSAVPYQPDGTFSVSDDMLGSEFSSNAMVWSGALSSDKTVNQGDAVAVVLEYKSGGFTASDSVTAATVNMSNGFNFLYMSGGGPLINTAGSWSKASDSQMTQIAFECDDGTYAFLLFQPCWVSLTSVSVATNVTARAVGNRFTVAEEITVDTFGMIVSQPNACNGTLTLDIVGGANLWSKLIDEDQLVANSGPRYVYGMSSSPITLSPGTTYRLHWDPSGTTAGTVYYGTVGANGILDCLPLGKNCYYTQRNSGGTWTDTNTSRCHMLIGISGVHDGAGGGAPLIGGKLIR